MTSPAQALLADLARHAALRDGMLRHRDGLLAAHRHAVVHCDQARARLAKEGTDVANLEGVSLARIAAALHGSTEADLSRERAEAAMAQHDLAQADARRLSVEAELRTIDGQLFAYADLGERTRVALDQRQAEVAADPALRPLAARIDQMYGEVGAAQAAVSQLDQVISAMNRAEGLLRAAHGELTVAHHSAAIFDLGSESLLPKYERYSRMQTAADFLSQAQAALTFLSAHLSGLGQLSPEALHVPMALQGLDVFLPSSIVDVALAGQVFQTLMSVQSALDALTSLRPQMVWQRDQAFARIDQLTQQRAELLGHG